MYNLNTNHIPKKGRAFFLFWPHLRSTAFGAYFLRGIYEKRLLHKN